MAKNKQIVIELHEGCLAPDYKLFELLQEQPEGSTEREQTVAQWLYERLRDDPDVIIFDKIEVIDCDCNLGD